ncbi:MAG: penicillin-insensitive murein endopeptidase [Pseudobdellovibrio sp.]
MLKLKKTFLNKNLILALGLLGLLTACGPKSQPAKSQINDNKKDLIFEAPATPTVNIPNGSANVYEQPATQLKTKDNKTVIVGSTAVNNAKVQYSSIERKLIVTGEVEILDNKKQKLAGKTFSLIGYHKPDETLFSLYDQNDDSDKSLVVRAQTTCIGINDDSQFDCSHVVVDIYLSYNKVNYTEQLEAFNKIDKPSDPSPATQLPAPAPTADKPNPGQDQQSEGDDQSLNGRYQGTIDVVDLDKLFATPVPPPPPPLAAPEPKPAQPKPSQPAPKPTQPAPKPNQPPPKPPATPTTPPKTTTPPPVQTQPPVKPTPAPDETGTSNPAPQSNGTVPSGNKILSDDLLETLDGKIRQYNQAFGFPNAGHLRNSTSLLDLQKLSNNSEFFEIAVPSREKHYGTYEMSQFVLRAAKYIKTTYNHILYVGNTSLKNGGKSVPHKSHQIGVDVDIAYPTDAKGVLFPVVATMSPHKFYTDRYSTEKTYFLLKDLFTDPSTKIDRIFVDQLIKDDLCAFARKQGETTGKDKELVRTMFENIQHVDGHGDHFHVRIKCSEMDPACRSMIYRRMDSCVD